MVSQRDKVYINHILEEISRINIFLTDVNEADFLSGDVWEKHYAVVRGLEIIGEAASSLSTELKTEFSDIPWRLMSDMRNKIIHEYMSVDYTVVWETATVDLPKLVKPLESILES